MLKSIHYPNKIKKTCDICIKDQLEQLFRISVRKNTTMTMKLTVSVTNSISGESNIYIIKNAFKRTSGYTYQIDNNDILSFEQSVGPCGEGIRLGLLGELTYEIHSNQIIIFINPNEHRIHCTSQLSVTIFGGIAKIAD